MIKYIVSGMVVAFSLFTIFYPSMYDQMSEDILACIESTGGYCNRDLLGYFIPVGAIVTTVSGGVLGFYFWRRQSNNKNKDALKTVSTSHKSSSYSPSLRSSNTEQELQKAKEMLDKGLIDEEEFKAMKKRIIERS